jgi:hypothetical protein
MLDGLLYHRFWPAGSIVNAALGKIYLLTADHCFTDKNEISDFEYWLLIFNYQSPCNNETAPPFTQIVQACSRFLLSCHFSRCIHNGILTGNCCPFGCLCSLKLWIGPLSVCGYYSM